MLASIGKRRPDLSVVVVVHNMPREAPRTLLSLSAAYQLHIGAGEYEVVVVDNGSEPPLSRRLLDELPGSFRLERVDPAPASPAHAANHGLAAARGDVIGLMIDGARIVTPGMLHFGRQGARLYERSVAATLGWHLGYDFQSAAIQYGYDAGREDALLASVDWPADGYRLFEIGTMDESSVDGWFTPIAESNALFLRRELWRELEGVDERFDLPGGGLLNLDLFRRALQLERAELVLLLGEATFHQVHQGISTNAHPDMHPENWARWSKQYEQIRGEAYQVPDQAPTYLGRLPRPALSRFVRAALRPVELARLDAPPLGATFDADLWAAAPPGASSDPTSAALAELARDEFRAAHYAAAAAVARIAAARGADQGGIGPLLALAAPWLSLRYPMGRERAEYHHALARAHRILGEDELAAAHERDALASETEARMP